MDDPLTPEEQDFRAMLDDPQRFREWAAAIRARWEKSPRGKPHVDRCYRTIGGFRVVTAKGAA